MKKIIILSLLALFTATSQAYEVRKLLSSFNPSSCLSHDKTTLYWGLGIATVAVAGVGGAYYYFKHYRKSSPSRLVLPLSSPASKTLQAVPPASHFNAPVISIIAPCPATEPLPQQMQSILQPPIGMQNFKNSCYFNATVQALYNSDAVRDLLIRQNKMFRTVPNILSHQLKPNQGELAVRLTQFIADYSALNTQQPIVEQHPLFKQLELLYTKCSAYMYRDNGLAERDAVNNNTVSFNELNGHQHDASELLAALIDQLRDIKVDSTLDQQRHALFTLCMGSKLSSSNQHSSISEQNENSLLVNIHGSNPTVQQCIDAHCAPELLEDRITTKQLMVVRPTPRIVPVVLKRFVFNPKTLQLERDGQAVHIDEQIQLPVEHNNMKSTQKYNLSSIVAHKGNSKDHGHYIAYVKRPNGQWYCCDDTTITPLTWEQVRNMCAKIAYVLMYEQTKN